MRNIYSEGQKEIKERETCLNQIFTAEMHKNWGFFFTYQDRCVFKVREVINLKLFTQKNNWEPLFFMLPELLHTKTKPEMQKKANFKIVSYLNNFEYL